MPSGLPGLEDVGDTHTRWFFLLHPCGQASHRPGVGVVLELGADEIRILLALPGRREIENLALRHLLAHLGDAARVRVERDNGNWGVSVYGVGVAGSFPAKNAGCFQGRLVYSRVGELLLERSTPVEEMRQRAETAG